MKEVLRISLMLDFYGTLMTRRQYQVMDDYYNNDYSLSEISDNLDISRQGVYDIIKKGRALLDRFEKKLGLVDRHLKMKKEILKIIEELDSTSFSDMRNKMQQLLKLI